MLALNVRRILLALATVSLGLVASTAMAQRYGIGGYRHGHIGHGYGGYYGGISSSYYRGHGHYGYGFPSRGVSVSIGGGYPYGYGGFGYGGIGYRSYGYGGLGYGMYGYPYSSLSLYRGYSPYYSSRVGVGLVYGASPSYLYVPRDTHVSGYRYGAVPLASDGLPDDASEFSHRQAGDPISSASSDLRPGMILPDGSKVISVGPLGAAAPDQAEALPSEPLPTQAAAPKAAPPKAAPLKAGPPKAVPDAATDKQNATSL